VQRGYNPQWPAPDPLPSIAPNSSQNSPPPHIRKINRSTFLIYTPEDPLSHYSAVLR
jgi:hypothetical protein